MTRPNIQPPQPPQPATLESYALYLEFYAKYLEAVAPWTLPKQSATRTTTAAAPELKPAPKMVSKSTATSHQRVDKEVGTVAIPETVAKLPLMRSSATDPRTVKEAVARVAEKWTTVQSRSQKRRDGKEAKNEILRAKAAQMNATAALTLARAKKESIRVDHLAKQEGTYTEKTVQRDAAGRVIAQAEKKVSVSTQGGSAPSVQTSLPKLVSAPPSQCELCKSFGEIARVETSYGKKKICSRCAMKYSSPAASAATARATEKAMRKAFDFED